MLRRPPTLITLTPEDIAAYEESRLTRLRTENIDPNATPNRHNANGETATTPSAELKPSSGDWPKGAAAGLTTRNERILGR
ncbi:hypothetical protein MMC20_005996 [Loxospora ochrophaea]|nr:hypothetical protein [Loxospora ochrophaea]